MKKRPLLRVLALFAGILLATLGAVSVFAGSASGAGTHQVVEGVFAQFQFNHGGVQCKIAHGVLPDGTVIQMFMTSTTVDSFDVSGNSATITGEMVSTTIFGQGRDRIVLSESVPYVATGVDNATPGIGADDFFLTVEYSDTPGQQGQIFEGGFGTCDGTTCTITFGGTLVRGNISVR